MSIFSPGHPRAGKIMGPRMVTLEADWIDEGNLEVNGGAGTFIQVYPGGAAFTEEEIIKCID